MTLRDRVREWLGLADIEARQKLDFLVAEDNAQARHIQIINLLSALNKRMINEHVAPRQFSEPVLDWETVQAMALVELERNPQKEN